VIKFLYSHGFAWIGAAHRHSAPAVAERGKSIDNNGLMK
jgi:hypothetical protein